MKRRLNILFITRFMQSYIEKSTYYLGEELSKHTNLTYWYEDGNLPDIIAQLSPRPDFILFNDHKPDYCPIIYQVNKVNIPKGALVHDLHYLPGRRKKNYRKNNINYLFVQYRDAFLKWYPEFNDRIIWLPHHVPGHIFYDQKRPRDIDMLMVGSLIEHLYPLRVKMYNHYRNFSDFTYFQHPGYRHVNSSKKGIITGNSYAEALNRSKLFLTCDSIYHFPVLKYFEALACGTLLLASGSKELEALGFIDGQTFIQVTEANFATKANYYLRNEQERSRIVSKGMELIHERHTTEIRAKQLLGRIRKILNDGRKF
ncbi:glycosyltransferase [Bacillus sp. Marseille-Q3570]|uniref:glycosyltransferase family protein n=1 Tax=Bacillus sp. Marseille-Q3570 TaxID=2963522 RepID=UPI0021B6EC91|nr:glycosyltransferase [Bacillus sp. Marseille-Q3570]